MQSVTLKTNNICYTESFEANRESLWSDLSKADIFVDAIMYHEGYVEAAYQRQQEDHNEPTDIIVTDTDDLATADELGLE